MFYPNEVEAAAKAICRAQFGSEREHGDARCCQVGGKDGCCLESIRPLAEAALIAAAQARTEYMDEELAKLTG